jgi:DNA helicase-2/ATP-dependent DNA helicase PcrA
LEWDAVFLAGMSEGLMPISLATTPEAQNEERRLLYVGVTRARIHLEASFGRARHAGGRGTRKRTRFLDGLWPESTPQRAKTKPRDLLTGDADPALFEALRAWRAELAKEQSKPAYTIFSDTVLVALAESRPTDNAGLARISGIGPAKIEKYGEPVLGIVAQHR